MFGRHAFALLLALAPCTRSGAEALRCRDVWDAWWARPENKVYDFDYARYLSAKENYAGDPGLMKTFPPAQIEDKLAWIEVASRVGPLAATPAKSAQVRQVLATLNFNRGLTFTEASEASAKLYRINHGDALSPLKLKELGFAGNVDSVLRDKFEAAFAQENFRSALLDLGFLRPSTVNEKNAAAKKLLAPFFDRMMAVMGALGAAHGQPGLYAPKLSLLAQKKLNAELLAKAMEGGFDSILPDLRAAYGKNAAFDLTWGWMRNSFNGISLVYALNWYNGKRVAQEKLNDEIWNGWLVNYRRVRGQDADPNSPEYHFYYDRIHRKLEILFQTPEK